MTKYTVSDINNETEIGGEIFRVEINPSNASEVTVYIDGGYGQDPIDESWMLIDGDFEIKTIELNEKIENRDQEFEIEINTNDIAKATAYRSEYPRDIGTK